jgi:hypothetical protein
VVEDLTKKTSRAVLSSVMVRLSRSRHAALVFQLEAAFWGVANEFVDSSRQEYNGKYQKSYAGISKQPLDPHKMTLFRRIDVVKSENSKTRRHEDSNHSPNRSSPNAAGMWKFG